MPASWRSARILTLPFILDKKPGLPFLQFIPQTVALAHPRMFPAKVIY
jgi:hypothetical protein